MLKRIRKAILAAKLRLHGVCPKHGTKLTRNFIWNGAEGAWKESYALRCFTCEEEAAHRFAAIEESRHAAEKERIQKMLEEYKSL